jgi:hypothetical protein
MRPDDQTSNYYLRFLNLRLPSAVLFARSSSVV